MMETRYKYRVSAEPCGTPQWVESNEVTTNPDDWGMKFDGVDDYADAPSSTSLSVTGTITVEAWVVLQELGYYNMIVSKHKNNASEGGYQLAVTDLNKPVFATYGSAGTVLASIEGSAALQSKRWYHLAAVYNGSTIYMFVDGQLAGSSAVGANKGPASSSSALQMGRLLKLDGTGMKYLRGKVDEVRISSTARYTAAFTPSQNHTSDANTRALWKLNEGSSTTAGDASTNGNTATLRNGTLWKAGVTTNNVDKKPRRRKSRASSGAAAATDAGPQDSAKSGVSQIGEQTWTDNYSYDRFGNRVGVADPLTNKLSGTNYVHDSAGNMTREPIGAGTQEYEYSAENRMWRARTGAGTELGKYVYDGNGARVKTITPTSTRRYIYNASGALIAEYVDAATTPEKEYVYGASGLLATVDLAQGGAVRYLTPDHLGSPRVVTDGASGGSVVSRHDYLPFGGEIGTAVGNRSAIAGYGGVDNIRRKFTSYERDTETGLDFAQARYYESSLGRFTSADPLLSSGIEDDPRTWNRYSYALKNPVKLTDPTGLYVFDKSVSPDQQKEFDAALANAKDTLNCLDPKSKEYKLLERALNAYGAKGAKGVTIHVGVVKGAADGKTVVAKTGITVTLEKGVVDSSKLIAHEGVHVADGKDFNKTGNSVTNYEGEFNAYTAQALVSEHLEQTMTHFLNAKIPIHGKGGRVVNGIPIRAEITNPSWREADREVLRSRAINTFLATPKVLGGTYEVRPTDRTPMFKRGR